MNESTHGNRKSPSRLGSHFDQTITGQAGLGGPHASDGRDLILPDPSRRGPAGRASGRAFPAYTANRAVNAVRYVCAAPPGIVTTADLPQIIARLT
jgi:hypothetical protein